MGISICSALLLCGASLAQANDTWTAPVKNTLPSLQAMMQKLAASVTYSPAPLSPEPPVPPQQSIQVTTSLMCGDQDVNNFAGGVNPLVPGSLSEQVDFLQSSQKISLVLGYWIVPGSPAPIASNSPESATDAFVPGKTNPSTGQTTAWYPLATTTMTVASGTNPSATVLAMTPVNKSGTTALGNLVAQKANSLMQSIGGGSYAMPGTSSTKYTAYIGLMACNSTYGNVSNGGSPGGLPDSLEIADFQRNLRGQVDTCLTASSCYLNYTQNKGIYLTANAGDPTAWNHKLTLSNSPLWAVGNALANGQTVSTNNWNTAITGTSSTKCSIPGENPRWYESAVPMNVTCEILGPNPSQLNPGPVVAAGIAQEAQNELATSISQPTVACFKTPYVSPSYAYEEYIDHILASEVIPFVSQGSNLVALVPGGKTGMTHPEALFANENFMQDYCTSTSSGCNQNGSGDFHAIFGMTAAPTPSMLAERSSNLDFLAQLLVPDARALMKMPSVEGGPDAATAGETYKAGSGMVAGGSVVSTAVYASSLVGYPSVQAAENVQYGIPIQSGGANTGGPSNLTVSNLYPSGGLSLILNMRARGNGSSTCPKRFCKADGPSNDLFE
jgi:hypothetical protein